MPGLAYTLETMRAMRRFGWRDLLLFVAFFGLLLAVMPLLRGMRAPFAASVPMEINLSPASLPGYAARSLLRMFLAFFASIVFTLIYGYVAARNKRAEK